MDGKLFKKMTGFEELVEVCPICGHRTVIKDLDDFDINPDAVDENGQVMTICHYCQEEFDNWMSNE